MKSQLEKLWQKLWFHVWFGGMKVQTVPDVTPQEIHNFSSPSLEGLWKGCRLAAWSGQATTKSESQKEVSGKSLPFNLFICYHIRVRLHFPRFARTRPVVLCNGSLRDPNVQTGIPGDQSTFSPASSTFLLSVDLLFWEYGWLHPLSPHLHWSLPF